MKNAVIGGVVTLVGVVLIGLLVAFSGLINVGADASPPAALEWFLHTTMERSVHARLDDIEVPPLDDPALVREGASHYDSMCVACHGAPGVEPGEIAEGLNPPPPELAGEEADEPAELFWVTKHGIQMTGMPGWGTTHDDESIWGMVALMMRFEEMSAAEYEELVASAEGRHHGEGEGDGHDHGDHEH